MGKLKFSQLSPDGSGKSAFFMSKELAFEKGIRNCPTMDADKLFFLSVAVAMDELGHNSFSRSRFAGE